MNLLAIDTSTEACSVAVLTPDGVFEKFELAPRKHTQLILPMLKVMLADLEMSIKEIDVFAFARGPGSFTGVRVSSSIIQGLAFSGNKLVVSVSSLAAMAQGAYRNEGTQRVIVAQDARMNEIYWGIYHCNEKGYMEVEGKDQLLKPENVTLLKENDYVGIGNAWELFSDSLREVKQNNLTRVIPEQYPRAYDIALLGQHLYQLGNIQSAELALPIYLRDAVVSRHLG